MKNIIILAFLVIFAHASFAQNQIENQLRLPQEGKQGWYKQNSGTKSYLPTIWFVNKDTGWVSSVNDGLLGTTNGGDTWTIINPAPCYGVQFVDGKHGYVAINSGGLLKSADGGKTGEAITIPFGGKIKLFGMDTIYIFNKANPSFAASNDGGKTWSKEDTTGVMGHAQEGAMSFSDSKYGFLCGMQVGWFWDYPPAKGAVGAGFVVTTDGGITWHNKYCPIQEDLHAIFAVDPKWIYIAGGNISLSTDGGDTWNSRSNLGGLVESFYFFNRASGYFCGAPGSIYFTNDSGKTWVPQNGTVAFSLYDMIFVDSLTGWCSGEQGAIVHTIDGGKSFVQQHTYDSLAIQTYPEPVTTPILYFHYKLPASQHVTLILYDLLGHFAQTVLQNDFEVQGEHTIPANLLQIPNGTYYYMFTSEHYKSSGHITLSR